MLLGELIEHSRTEDLFLTPKNPKPPNTSRAAIGYNALQVASLFLFYEIFGIITNFCGGYLGSRFGLKTTLFMGLCTQLAALSMLGLMPPSSLTVAYVMISQALSGIAKDLTKMSSKSAVKLVAGDSEGRLYKWVALLTGSKNALKGVGFFLGSLLLSLIGFQASVWTLAAVVALGLITAATMMRGGLGTANKKAKFSQMFSRNSAVNMLAVARLFLFGARDVWFVVAVPVFLSSVLGWKFWQAGGFMAVWVIGYGAVQASAPRFCAESPVTPKSNRTVTPPPGWRSCSRVFRPPLLPRFISISVPALPSSPGSFCSASSSRSTPPFIPTSSSPTPMTKRWR